MAGESKDKEKENEGKFLHFWNNNTKKVNVMDNYIYFALVAATLAIYAMVDISMRNFSINKKMIWFPIVVLLPLIGPLTYFVRRRSILEKAK